MPVKKDQMRKNGFCDGFTLVELSLSLVLIAVLSLIIALLIMNILSSYRRGLALNQVNTAGIDIVDDMRTAVQRSSAKSAIEKCKDVYSGQSENIARCEENEGREFIVSAKEAVVQGVGLVPVTGVFCTGTYSYIWNSGYFFAQKSDVEGALKTKFTYSNGRNDYTKDDFRLLKVWDTGRIVCVAVSKKAFENNTIDVRNEGLITEEPVDLLASADAGLALYDLSAITSTEKGAVSGGLFYTVSFVLGTVQGGVNIAASGNFCSVPNDYENQSFDYCSINKFNFAARATGGR